jgi:hypothetical protein
MVVSKPEPTLPRAIPGFTHHIIIMDEDDEDFKNNFWDSFPAPIPSGPPALPVRNMKRAREIDVEDRNVRQRLCF